MSTPSTILNEKLRGKKLNISSDKKNLISNALSLVWSITNKKIESCTFLTKNTGDVVKIIYKGGEGSFFFDLHNEDNKELLTDFMVRIGLFFSILSYIKSLTYLSNYFSNDNVSKASVEQGANETKGGKELAAKDDEKVPAETPANANETKGGKESAARDDEKVLAETPATKDVRGKNKYNKKFY